MIVGTAGHIDHGKTSLVKALTGVDADRLKEEKERGITIDLGFAYWPQPDGSVIGFVDVPGHERFVHTMLAGAQTVDLVLLVVAADDGIMPQTREHLEILSLLGLSRGIVALTKADLVDAARLRQVTAEIDTLLAASPLAGSRVLPVSSATGEGVEALAAALAAAHRDLTARASDRLFRLAVDRSFVLRGAGTVVTGMVLDGRVAVGDEVVVSPAGHTARVRSLHAQNRKAERGTAGDRCAINLAGPRISRDAVSRGDVVTVAAGHAPTTRLDVELTVAAGAAKGIGQWMPVRVHQATAEIGGRVVLLADGKPLPGETVLAQIALDAPIAARVHDRFVLRDVSASRTLGGGRILDLRAPERRRRAPERLALLGRLAATADRESLAAVLDLSGTLDIPVFAADRGLTAEQCAAWARETGATVVAAAHRLVAVGAPFLEGLSARVRERLATFHEGNPDRPGLGLDRLRVQAAPRLDPALFRLLLQGFAGEGWLAVDGPWARLASHRVELSPADEALWSAIHPMLGGSERFRPPRVRDVARVSGTEEAAIRQVMRRVARTGEIHEVAHDHFFLRGALDELVAIAGAAQAGEQGWFSAATFRDRAEAACGGTVGRKVAIQVLEFLDRHGVTLRRGDARRLNPHRTALFGVPAEPGLDGQAGAGDISSELGREASPVGRPDFKSGGGRQAVSGGFDSHSLPPIPPDGAHDDRRR